MEAFGPVERASAAMGENFLTYINKSLEVLGKDIREMGPHIQTFINGIPNDAFKEFVMNLSQTALNLNKEYCGGVELDYRKSGVRYHVLILPIMFFL